MQATGTNPPLSDNIKRKPKGKGKRGRYQPNAWSKENLFELADDNDDNAS